ncbi:MAG: MoxR family ATPase [Propionibacteriaceae bacterium]|nr:MoxR family ATPase [Propionibacteriaceae bacterium]
MSRASELLSEVLDALDQVIVGKRAELSLVLAGVVAGGHVLIEDLPGLGKTLAARTLAATLGLDFRRAQFTPDLLPSDLTGSSIYRPDAGRWEFQPGPVFTGLLLADEINRTPAKTQAALLEAMQERQVTIDGTTHTLPAPFHVIATANPIEHEGTYPLPEAQLDRFLLRLSFGYPSAEEEWEVVRRRFQRRRDEPQVDAVMDAAVLTAVQDAVEDVHVSDEVGRYIVALVTGTREHEHCLAGASPRGSLALAGIARAWALLQGREYVTPQDVKHCAVPALAHRVTLRPELWLAQVTAAQVVVEVVSSTTVPDTVPRATTTEQR